MYPDIATLCNSKRRVVSKGTCPFYRDVWQVQKVPRWGCETNVCLPTIRQTRWILRVTSSFFGTECVFPVFMVYILFSHINVSTNCPGTWGFGYPFPFRSLGTNCDCTIEEASGNDWHSKRSKVTRTISPVFFMVQMTFAVCAWTTLISFVGKLVRTTCCNPKLDMSSFSGEIR